MMDLKETKSFRTERNIALWGRTQSSAFFLRSSRSKHSTVGSNAFNFDQVGRNIARPGSISMEHIFPLVELVET